MRGSSGLHLPAAWPEGLARSESYDWSSRTPWTIIRASERHGVSPPRLDVRQPDRSVLRELQREEDEQDGNCHAAIESSGQDVVVLGPPGEMTSSNHVLEYEADNSPWNVVDGSCGRYEASAVEDDREVDVFQETVRVSPIEEPRDERCESSHEEEENEWIVGLAFAEL